MNKGQTNLNLWIIIMAVAIAAKFLLFYSLVDISSNFVIVVAISAIFTYGLFFVFKKKVIPSVIYLLFSILMFCDWTYYSFFSRYLSITLLGSAEVVGDIKESIIEVIKPINFLLLIDAVIIFIVYSVKAVYSKRKRSILIADFIEVIVREFSSWVSLLFSIRQPNGEYRCITDYFFTFFKELLKVAKSFGIIVIGIPRDIFAVIFEKKVNVANRNVAEKKTAFGRRKNAFCRTVTALMMIGVLALTYSVGYSGSFVTSIKNQELYNYHVSDILENIFADDKGSLAAFDDTYGKEKEGKLFGIAKDRNLVFIQMESFMNFVIDREYNGQELTPNLNALIRNNSTYFDNFYQQVGSGNTSDSEFAANNSIYGTVLSYTYKVYGETNYFRGLPVLLKEKGYDTAVFHAFEDMDFWNRKNAYSNLGFDKYFGGLQGRDGYYKMTEWVGWGLSDSEFFEQTIPLMQENLEEPYYAFVNTLTNHHPFQMLEHHKFIELLPEDEGTLVGNYLQSVAYTDYSIGLFLESLKEEGMYDDSIFVLYGDHAGLTHSEETDECMERLLGQTYDYDTMLRVPMIIHIPGASQEMPEKISISGGHLDIMPTVAYLMGFDELDTIYFGHNLYNVQENLVAEQTFIKRGSFVYGDIMYEMALDGVYENGRAWNMKTGEMVQLEGLKEQYLKTMDIIQSSEYILKTDALRSIYLDGEELSSLVGEKAKRREFMTEFARAGYPEIDFTDAVASDEGNSSNPGLIKQGSIEALDASYEAGYRYIWISLRWTNDGKECYTVDENGQKAMNHNDIINWMSEHEDVHLIIDIDGGYIHSLDNTLTFFGTQGEGGTQTGRRMILIAENTKDFSGRHDLFLDVSACNQSNEDLMNFVERNDVWAIMMTEEDFRDSRAELADFGVEFGCGVYIEEPSGKVYKL